MSKVSAITERRLFSLLRMALFEREEDLSIFKGMSDNDWKEIYSVALEQGVLAFAYDGATYLYEEIQPSIEIKIQWAYNIAYIEKIFAKQQRTAQRFVKALTPYEIKPVILKGLSNASLFNNPAHRQAGDIDIHLMGDYAKGNKIAKSMGLKVRYDFFVHSEFKMNGINIENHLFFVNPFVNATGKYVQDVLSAVSAESLLPHPIIDGAYMLPHEESALFLIRHSSWHYAREGIKLRDICDWAMFLYKCGDTMDCTKVLKLLTESGLDRYAAIMTHIATQHLRLIPQLKFDTDYSDLAQRVKNDILSFCNPEKHSDIGFIRAFFLKMRNRISRKWCYDDVVPDSYWGNIFYSIKGYLTNPSAIFKAKL